MICFLGSTQRLHGLKTRVCGISVWRTNQKAVICELEPWNFGCDSSWNREIWVLGLHKDRAKADAGSDCKYSIAWQIMLHFHTLSFLLLQPHFSIHIYFHKQFAIYFYASWNRDSEFVCGWLISGLGCLPVAAPGVRRFRKVTHIWFTQRWTRYSTIYVLFVSVAFLLSLGHSCRMEVAWKHYVSNSW